jgi:hypothetical protein
MGCTNSTDVAFKRVAQSIHSAPNRDGVAIIVDWDDTIFPSSCLKSNLHKHVETLRAHPAVRAHYRQLVEFFTTAAPHGHLFIVTAARVGFIQKSCRFLFPDLFDKIQELGVPILYSRPAGEEKPLESDKAMMFAMALGHERPIPASQARFYDDELISPWQDGTPVSGNWHQVFSIGDALEDLTALQMAIGHHPCSKKLVKFRDDPGLGELTRQLGVLTKHFQALVALERSVTVDIDSPLHAQMYATDLPSFSSDESDEKVESVPSCSTMVETDDEGAMDGLCPESQKKGIWNDGLRESWQTSS